MIQNENSPSNEKILFTKKNNIKILLPDPRFVENIIRNRLKLFRIQLASIWISWSDFDSLWSDKKMCHHGRTVSLNGIIYWNSDSTHQVIKEKFIRQKNLSLENINYADL